MCRRDSVHTFFCPANLRTLNWFLRDYATSTIYANKSAIPKAFEANIQANID